MKPFLKSHIHTFELIVLPVFAVFTVVGFCRLPWFVYGVLLSGLVLCVGYFFAGAYLFAYPEIKRYRLYPILCGLAYGFVVVAILQCAIRSGFAPYFSLMAAVPLGLLWSSFVYHIGRGKMGRYYLRLHVIRAIILTVLFAGAYWCWK